MTNVLVTHWWFSYSWAVLQSTKASSAFHSALPKESRLGMDKSCEGTPFQHSIFYDSVILTADPNWPNGYCMSCNVTPVNKKHEVVFPRWTRWLGIGLFGGGGMQLCNCLCIAPSPSCYHFNNLNIDSQYFLFFFFLLFLFSPLFCCRDWEWGVSKQADIWVLKLLAVINPIQPSKRYGSHGYTLCTTGQCPWSFSG